MIFEGFNVLFWVEILEFDSEIVWSWEDGLGRRVDLYVVYLVVVVM